MGGGDGNVRGEDELVSGVPVAWPHGKVQEVIGSSGLEASSEVWARQRFGNGWVAQERMQIQEEGLRGRVLGGERTGDRPEERSKARSKLCRECQYQQAEGPGCSPRRLSVTLERANSGWGGRRRQTDRSWPGRPEVMKRQ